MSYTPSVSIVQKRRISLDLNAGQILDIVATEVRKIMGLNEGIRLEVDRDPLGGACFHAIEPMEPTEFYHPKASPQTPKKAPPAAKVAAAASPTKPLPWSPEEDAVVLRLAAESPEASKLQISHIASGLLNNRSQKAVYFRMKSVLKDRLDKPRPDAPSMPKKPPQSAPAAVGTPAPSNRPASLALPQRADVPSELRGHVTALPRPDGWVLKDDLELMQRATAGENMALISAAMEREAAFVVRRFDLLVGRKGGGQMRFSRVAVVQALADAVAAQGGKA